MSFQKNFSFHDRASAAQDFEKRAGIFDSSSRWVKDEMVNSVPFRFLSRRSSLGHVLDAGGGTGYLTYFLSQRLPTTSITIVDASMNMLEKAEERLPQATLVCQNVETFCRDSSKRFDTILARQIFHYVDDVDVVISLLQNQLEDDGLLYVGQFVVRGREADQWHERFIQKISRNRKRSFLMEDFLTLFQKHDLRILEVETMDYEENIQAFYQRKMNDGISYDRLLQSSKDSLSEEVIQQLAVRTTEDNLFFTVQFCHLLLSKEG